MYKSITSGTLSGIQGKLIRVEVDISDGLPAFDMVGYLDAGVKEAKERVRTAIKNSEFNFPIKRVTVNLSPADIKKEGPSYDLPIAIAILSCLGVVSDTTLSKTLIIGELSLNGKVNRVNGLLPITYAAYTEGYQRCIVPAENVNEAAVVEGIEVIGVNSLAELVCYLNNQVTLTPTKMNLSSLFTGSLQGYPLDFSDIRGQEHVRRALEVAASGMHNVLLIGSPGSGKTMLAKRIPTILPDLSFDESIEITKIYSISGLLSNHNSLITTRPFRSPHHTVSTSALTGGGKIPKPGEISLAHGGVLFLDELPEFTKNALEVMRQPLEDKQVTIARVNGTYTFPSDFMLVASMNPCPCGYYPDTLKCTCTPLQIRKYLGKISGPLLDRIDIQVEAEVLKYESLGSKEISEASANIKKRVEQALFIQKERFQKEQIYFNSQMTPKMIEKYCDLEDAEKKLLRKVYETLNLSGRAYHKILKTARTIADLAGSERIELVHLSEAIYYRSLDKKYWK